MSGLLPSDAEAEDADADVDVEAGADVNGTDDLRVLWLDDEDAERLITSLSSDTARAVVTALYDERGTASELAERVDTSLQNVRHHLDHLQEAGLVRVVDTRYSVKGREMNVYGPTDDSLVVAVGREEDREGFLDSLGRFVGALAGLALVGALVEVAFGTGANLLPVAGPGTAPRVADGFAPGTDPLLGLVPPGVAFVAGGLLVLATVLAWERTRG
jgi:DNA-binding transcriptional ArsR family regulator